MYVPALQTSQLTCIPVDNSFKLVNIIILTCLQSQKMCQDFFMEKAFMNRWGFGEEGL